MSCSTGEFSANNFELSGVCIINLAKSEDVFTHMASSQRNTQEDTRYPQAAGSNILAQNSFKWAHVFHVPQINSTESFYYNFQTN